jgi:hypothetical protein
LDNGTDREVDGDTLFDINPYFPNKLHRQELVAYNKAT